MSCKKHPFDQSSTVGVCATCLRQRLFVLIAAQTQYQAQSDHRLKSENPPPLVFPRSVSPYIPRPKSDHRFFSTPLVGPTSTSATAAIITGVCSKTKPSRFSLLSNLFWFRSVKHKSDRVTSDKPISSSSLSWFSSLFSTHQKKQSRFCIEETRSKSRSGGCRKPSRVIDRGMSPVRATGRTIDDGDLSPSGSGYSSESSHVWKMTPVAGPLTTARRVKPGHVSGLAFCLSPLVRASPNRQWNQKGGLPPDISFSGEVRGPIKPHLSNAASFGANRSRKLADFGRASNR